MATVTTDPLSLKIFVHPKRRLFSYINTCLFTPDQNLLAFQGELRFPVIGVDEEHLPFLYPQQQQKLAGTSQHIITNIAKFIFKTIFNRVQKVAGLLGPQRPNEYMAIE